MSLFGPSIPKGITKKEALYLRGRLMAGRGAEKLTSLAVERIMELVDMAMDSDTYAERANNVQQVSAEEAARIEKNIADDISTTQQAYVRRIFQEFIDKNKVPGLF
ncbi:MAG: hypothetical protein A3C93_00055 [Candidatus Lloydbacteria bacterium RIFCSPHIGHO2_02_FULL_54_17]|uniref:DUF507 domain-containing protein n=1 Tax=Candidatus Lloydbacteria bacterium RIFCSPHIGHO2_02_FULL_54_17 TaxID=1798664 RepID=A0A1G2DIA5_9BACT|nr:MAG: hypothetical protein A3C93_00055 [Candidatus Lloydbacteria bacterium RIFCSPHIGHO2_02_FULL_54_17]OGZ17103.1 MAG: hypothetical protein A3H76_02850 [Candidatus Lloydbacteria bacterium RIFCSPLOWO2_02_FULL_54_12]